MEKIKMTTPLVEMDGDEMTRVLWGMIKEQLLLPFVDLKTEYYDLGLLHRNETEDRVTVDAANATRRLGVAVKCATITPNRQRMEEYPQLTQMWKSPNGTIRSILDGTVFRAPILIDTIHPVVKNWKKPITIARHAYGDVYKSVDLYTTEPGVCTMYLIRKLTNLSLPDTGKEFGRDHSTVLYAIRKVEVALKNGDSNVQNNVRDITANINSCL